MTIDKLSAAQLPQNVAKRLDDATLLGSTGLAALWRTLGGRETFWCVSSGGNINAVLTSVEFGTRPVKRLQAMPDGLYARPVLWNEDIETPTAATTLAATIAKNAYAKVIMNDYYDVMGQPANYTAHEQSTTVIDISAPHWQPPDPKILSELRKAEREGVTVVPFDMERDMAAFLDLMQRTEGRHGRTPKYPPPFWQGLAELARRDQRIRWVNVAHEGRLAASHVYFDEGDMVLHWQAYFDKEFSFLKPNQYLMYTVAHQAATRGALTLNQGASPPEAEGLLDYKLKWGGRERRYRSLQRRAGLGRWL